MDQGNGFVHSDRFPATLTWDPSQGILYVWFDRPDCLSACILISHLIRPSHLNPSTPFPAQSS